MRQDEAVSVVTFHEFVNKTGAFGAVEREDSGEQTKIFSDPKEAAAFAANTRANAFIFNVKREDKVFKVQTLPAATNLDFDRLNAVITQKKLIENALASDPKRVEALQALGIGTVDFQVIDERLHAGKEAPLSASVIKGEAKAVAAKPASQNKKNKKEKQDDAVATPVNAALPNTLQLSFGINPEDVAAKTASGENLRTLDAGTLLDQLVEAADKLKERNTTYEALKAGKLK
jgi:hypothetical protein